MLVVFLITCDPFETFFPLRTLNIYYVHDVFLHIFLPRPSRSYRLGGSISDTAFLLQSDFSGLPVGTYQAFPNIHPPQIPATPPSYESVSA